MLKQLDEVYQFLAMQNHVETTYQGLRRIDQYYYSQIALREALLNAIIHRDYGLGGHIFVNIYRNSCEFISLGSLPKGIALDDIYQGVSKSRNEKLAGLFYRLELIEAYGTGIMKIMSAYKEHSLLPEIITTSGAFILRMPSFVQSKPEKIVVKEETETYSVSNKQDLNLKDKEAVLADILKMTSESGHITRKDIQVHYGFGQTKSGMLLRELEASGKLTKGGKGKNAYYILS